MWCNNRPVLEGLSTMSYTHTPPTANTPTAPTCDPMSRGGTLLVFSAIYYKAVQKCAERKQMTASKLEDEEGRCGGRSGVGFEGCGACDTVCCMRLVHCDGAHKQRHRHDPWVGHTAPKQRHTYPKFRVSLSATCTGPSSPRSNWRSTSGKPCFRALIHTSQLLYHNPHPFLAPSSPLPPYSTDDLPAPDDSSTNVLKAPLLPHDAHLTHTHAHSHSHSHTPTHGSHASLATHAGHVSHTLTHHGSRQQLDVRMSQDDQLAGGKGGIAVGVGVGAGTGPGGGVGGGGGGGGHGVRLLSDRHDMV